MLCVPRQGCGQTQNAGQEKNKPKRRPLPESLPREEVLHDLVCKACPDCGQDHLPLYRQESIFGRMGMPIPRSTMAGWFGQLEALIETLTGRLIEKLTAQPLLHADETLVPVLDPGAGKTATGYLWAYRTGPWSPLQAVAYDFAMSRAAEAPKHFLASFTGTLLVDGYAGYNGVLARPGMIEAGCHAHARRYFHEVFEATGSPVAQHALAQFGKLYSIERKVRQGGFPGRLQSCGVCFHSAACPVAKNSRIDSASLGWLSLTTST